MSGHSKWSTIKRKKGAADAKRGKIFTRCIHEITVAVKEGGPDPTGNPRLRLAIDKAKTFNMPNDNIERAIERASGSGKGDDSVEVNYEGYGPGGCAVLVHVLTNNRNRTVGEIRSVFTRSGGSLGETGCVGWMFTKKGIFTVNREDISEEQITELALEGGADDVTGDDGYWEVTCSPEVFFKLKELIETKTKVNDANLEMLPSTRIPLSGDEAEQMMRLLENLEDLDDVVSVSSNCDFIDVQGGK